jgi:hypothetical protein
LQELFDIKGLVAIFLPNLEDLLARALGKEKLRHEYDAKVMYANSVNYDGRDPRSRWVVLRLPGSKYSFLHKVRPQIYLDRSQADLRKTVTHFFL